MTNLDYFADWLRRELEERGWDQAELARRSQTSTALISRMLSGERRPGAVVARRLARALHLSPEEVFRKAGMLPRPASQPPGLDDLINLYAELTPDDRERLIAVARAFLAKRDGV
ncbi:MAG: helix-turn-helix domain-containing protein [Armatimonadota bacterium]